MGSDLILEARKQVLKFQAGQLNSAGLIPQNGLYYPTIYYPPIPMHGPSNQAEILHDLKYDEFRLSSVYFHIPFCRSRCLYCHWMVNVNNSDHEIDNYLKLLATEMKLWKQKFGVSQLSPHSILIGGGTPTALSPQQTARMYRYLHENINLTRCAQITCETEPGTVLGEEGLEKLRIMKDNGVARVSLGVQAFDDQSLMDMGRQHSSDDVMRAIEQIRKIDFPSLSIDLIYGYPGCTLEKWLKTLETAKALNVDAFQLYRLRVVAHGDRIGSIATRFENNPDAFPSVDDVYAMKQLGAVVAAGCGLKETSRRYFTKGAEHDSQYMHDHADRLGDVIGFGASSWSNVQGRFYLNTGESIAKYAEYLTAGDLPINRGRIRSEDDERRWAVALTLKHNGVSKKQFELLTGVTVQEAFPKQIDYLKRHGLIQEDENLVSLTPRGIFFADEVVTQFYHAAYRPFPRSSYAEGELNPFCYDQPSV